MSDELYLERAKVRGIILRSQEIGGEVTQSLLMQVDHLPIVTADDMRGPAATPQSAPAATIGDTPSEPRPPASAAMGHSAGADTAATPQEPDWWRWRFLSQSHGWSKWIALDCDEVPAFRDLQAEGLEKGRVELQPLYALPRPDRATP